jgi:hypothetical protein
MSSGDVLGFPPNSWEAQLFDPKHTTWHGSVECYAQKSEILQIRFGPRVLAVLREYFRWCMDTHAGNCALHRASKAAPFLQHRIEQAVERWHQDEGRNSLPEECAMISFQAAIAPLNALAQWQGYPISLLDSEEVYLLQCKLRKEQSKARAATRDYAASSRFLSKRLTLDEQEDILEAWWDGRAAAAGASTESGQERHQMRGFLMHCLQKSLGRRGNDLRSIRLAMMFRHTLPNVRPVPSCHVVGFSLRDVKECKDNHEHILGIVRAKNRLECPMGALAAYLVWLIDIMGFPIFHILRESLQDTRTTNTASWWDLMLFSASDPATPVSYTLHHGHTTSAWKACDIHHKTAATHIYRNERACDLIEKGASVHDVGLYQGWYHDTAADTYLRGCFKTNPLLMSNGWENGNESFACWWEGNESDIPQEILQQVFPSLDDTLNLAKSSYKETRKDRSAVEFLRTLQLLRKIYIEDAVVKQPAYPTFPAYDRHTLFATPNYTWDVYRQAEVERTATRERVHGDAQQAKMMDLVKISVMEAIKECALQGSTHGLVSLPLMQPPATAERIPELHEPQDLYSCYAEWQQHRTYFYAHPAPPWKEQFGNLANTFKNRYYKLRPFFTYLDHTKTNAKTTLDQLEAIRTTYKVTASVFIKQCFYHLYHPPAANSKKPPPISPATMREEMAARNLPAPGSTL